MLGQAREGRGRDLLGAIELARQLDHGGVGFRVTKPAEVEAVIAKALKNRDSFTVIDFVVAKEENVYPMVPAGAALNEMVLA